MQESGTVNDDVFLILSVDYKDVITWKIDQGTHFSN